MTVRTTSLLLGALALATPSAVPAQTFPAGFRDTSFANTTGRGSTTLTARVYYPAQSAGRDAPLRPQAGGYPVLVFLHGFAALGSWYGPVGQHFAERGYVVVQGDTAQFDRTLQQQDGIATFTALQTANGQQGSFLRGALDMTRAGLFGHSMGGGNTVEVLASNPGYKAGVCIAPIDSANAARAGVPITVLHGTGDAIVPWQQGGKPLYDRLVANGTKSLYLLNDDANHTNVAGFFLITATDREVWGRCARVATGFFDAYLRGDTAGLEEVAGPAARAEPRLRQLELAVGATELWSIGAAKLAGAVRLTALAEPGPTALFAAAQTARIPTPFGDLLLDPATLIAVASGSAGADRLWSTSVAIPNDRTLIGARLPLQAAGQTVAAGPRLTGLATLVIEP